MCSIAATSLQEHGLQEKTNITKLKGNDALVGSNRLEKLVREMIVEIGEDPERDGLLRTPARVAKSYDFLLSGYDTDVAEVVNGALFDVTYNEMVICRDIDYFSLCEHHMLPFFGKAHVAYIPNGKVLGLSKMARLVEVFSRRLQVQERLTAQIADAMDEILNPQGVAVVLEGVHLCMVMRGVQKLNSLTITSSMRGAFQEDPKTREEFMTLIGGGSR